MTLRLIVVGAAGFGREVLDVIAAIVSSDCEPKMSLIGVIDDQPSRANLAKLSSRGVTYKGTTKEWLRGGDDAHFVIAIGDPITRRRLAELLEQQGRRAAILIHPTATVGYGVKFGPGAVVCAGVQVSSEVSLGAHGHLNPNATIGHDAQLDDFVSINPGAVISGECRIEDGVIIGAGAVVLQRLRVGARSVIGAAACVTRDVAADTVVTGVPARPHDGIRSPVDAGP